jgi:hypothetical protein
MGMRKPLPAGDGSTVADEQFADLFALGQILSTALKPKGYRSNAALRLGEYGRATWEGLSGANPALAEEEIRLALLDEMYWSDLFFVPDETNIRALESELSQGLSACSIRIPWVYGGYLYRKANKVFDRIKDRLDPKETLSLMSETPQGVCQMRTFVSGPLGLLRSKQKRNQPPTRSIPLWHCSDPSCSALHRALLCDEAQPKKAVLRSILRARGEDYAGVSLRYRRLSSDVEYYDDLNTSGLIALLGDAFGRIELQAIVIELLTRSKGLRAHLAELQLGGSFTGSAAQIASRLDEAGCLQTILLETDYAIAEAVDKLIAKGVINIPISETRSRRELSPTVSGWYNIDCEASCYGMRFVPNQAGVSLARLKRLIHNVHEGNSSDLAWRLRYTPGDSTSQKLDNFVNDHTPEETLREHVLVSPETLGKAFEIIRYGSFSMPNTAVEEKTLVNRLIWKLGFAVPAQPLQYQMLADNIKRLRDANHAYRNGNGDNNMARIRSEAVNVFVELERFLSDSLAFMTWVLTSDHYTGTHFSFEVGGHFERMAELFTTYQNDTNVENPLIFEPAGKNTLFPLINGFRLLAGYCRWLIANANLYTRPASERPGYADRATLQVFPFHHTRSAIPSSWIG